MPTNLYRPHDNYDLNNSHVQTVWRSGNPRRKFLHVDDMADAYVFLMERPDICDGLFNVGCGEDVSIRELAEIILKVVGLGWRARIGLGDGVRATSDDEGALAAMLTQAR